MATPEWKSGSLPPGLRLSSLPPGSSVFLKWDALKALGNGSSVPHSWGLFLVVLYLFSLRTQNVLGEKGRRIRELTAVVQKRFGFPEGSVEVKLPQRLGGAVEIVVAGWCQFKDGFGITWAMCYLASKNTPAYGETVLPQKDLLEIEQKVTHHLFLILNVRGVFPD